MSKPDHFTPMGVMLLSILSLMPGMPAPYAGDERRCAPAIGQLVSVQGRVEVRSAGEARWQVGALNDTLCGGDTVRTLPRSRTTLFLPAQQTTLQLDQSTTITLPDMAPSAAPFWLDLLEGAGHFLSRTPQAFKIKTPFVNSFIEGTEFVVRVERDQTLISVFNGTILASNDAGSLKLQSGQAAIAKAHQAPLPVLIARPWDAVQWALYYPPIIDYRSAVTDGSADAQALRDALGLYRQGRLLDAFARLDRVPPPRRDGRYFDIRAGLLLSVGRVDEARADLEQALRLHPGDGTAIALQSLIAVVQNDKDEALRLAKQAVSAEPRSPVPQIALSYVYQARFDIDKAFDSVREATRLAPDNALAWARLSELSLSKGDLDEALAAAKQAAALEPALARTQTVLGFADLTEIHLDDAKAAFHKAIALDPADPLPHLGLGLAQIRKGDLDEGTQDIEIAATLDPNNSLVRSYLGKAYYEQKRSGLAGTELHIAKALDPKDPTPWFYDAIRKQTENRPVEALGDLQKSIELNDNRAVYRSRLLLDQDLAARGATLGRIYQELGFEQQALVEGWTSSMMDPTDYSAHRLLSDSYSVLPHHEIARVSELLQSQLLQPLNISPIQPQLAETNLFLLGGLGPAQPSLNEFNQLFLGNRLSLLASGLVGSHGISGDEVVQSGIWDKASYSLGQFHYGFSGFRPNNDLNTDIYTIYGQYALSQKVNVQIELRRQNTEAGDLREFSNPDFLFENLRQTLDRNTARVGLHYSPGVGSDLVASFSYSTLHRQSTNPVVQSMAAVLKGAFFDVPGIESLASVLPAGIVTTGENFNDATYTTFELQYTNRWQWGNIVAGTGYSQRERATASYNGSALSSPLSPHVQQDLINNGAPLISGPEDADVVISEITKQLRPRSVTNLENSSESQANAYVYSTIVPQRTLNVTLGTTIQSRDRDSSQGEQVSQSTIYISPKLGANWQPLPWTNLRAAWFRAVRAPLSANQTIEPTHIAGFNQLFDDAPGTRFARYGFGIDQRLHAGLSTGFELTWRDAVVPLFIPSLIENGRTTEWIHRREASHRAYLHWNPTDRSTIGTEYFFEELDRAPATVLTPGEPLHSIRHQVPLSLTYHDPNGFFTRVTATHVDQDVTARGQAAEDRVSTEGHFWVTDVVLGYRLPKRYGIVTFGVKNLFDEVIRFQDASPNIIGDIEGELVPPLFTPERVFFGQVTLAF